MSLSLEPSLAVPTHAHMYVHTHTHIPVSRSSLSIRYFVRVLPPRTPRRKKRIHTVRLPTRLFFFLSPSGAPFSLIRHDRAPRYLANRRCISHFANVIASSYNFCMCMSMCMCILALFFIYKNYGCRKI